MTDAPLFRLSGPQHGPHAGGAPRRLVILLHGYGASGDDLIGLAPAWAPVLPHTLFVSPHAPYPCEANPDGGYQWFGIGRVDPALMLAGTRAAAPILDAFIDQTLAATGLTEAETALVGFSQGTMMALQVGLRRARPFAGIVGYSGLLTGAETLKDEIASRPPVLLIHGDADPMVPVQALHIARQVLAANGVPVETHVSAGLAHGIDEDGMILGARFLIRTLGEQPAATGG